MSDIFRQIERFVDDAPGEFVEIGSDRWEGSTLFLANLANRYNRSLHTVDVNDIAKKRLKNKVSNVQFYVMEGSRWCKEIWPTIGKSIRLLYLDNFDYDWNIDDHNNDMINEQKIKYHDQFGIEMTNENCQTEHMKQIIFLNPYLATRCTVVCDDTYQFNDCWIGKCGGVVLFLLTQGFKIVEKHDGIVGKPYGVILCR